MPKAKTDHSTPTGRTNRRRPSAPPDLRVASLQASSEPRMMELIGCDEDGNMSLWDTCNVLPVSTFRIFSDGLLESGHYVIDWKGHAITVHCSSRVGGKVAVHFMCSGADPVSMPRSKVEAMLLGRVIPDPKIHEQILRLLAELKVAKKASNAAPHLRRGKIA